MNSIGKPERESQNRIIQLFQNELEYQYLGNWQEEERVLPLEEDLLLNYLIGKGYSENLAGKAISKFHLAVANISQGLYEANKEVYKLLRYGVPVREELGKPKETVWLIDWKHPEENDFAVAEEVTVKGKA